jgi:hypothetical protein
MTTEAEGKTLSNKAVRLRLAMVSLMATGLAALGICFLYFTAPIPGNRCSVGHATTEDANGRTMSCNPKTIGNRDLVWQYTWAS